MNKNILIVAIVLFVIVGGIFWYRSNNQQPESSTSQANNAMQGGPESDTMKNKVDSALMTEVNGMEFMYQGTLQDVTKGEVRGIITNGQALGISKANFADGKYMMLATFSNLPDPVNGDFYEGWIVQKSPFQFISTGKVEKVDGVYTNIYSSGQDLTSHFRYVLTIEPNDGDPAPADHIVEGDMIRK